MGVHRRKILSAVGASMALIGGLLAATALVGVVPAGAVTLWAPTTACGVVDTTTVPAGVTSMTITVDGARAGAAGSGTSSGTEAHQECALAQHALVPIGHQPWSLPRVAEAAASQPAPPPRPAVAASAAMGRQRQRAAGPARPAPRAETVR